MGELRVQKDADGVWFARPYLGTDRVTGRPIRPYKRFPAAYDEAEAQRMAEQWFESVRGAAMGGSRTPLSVMLGHYLEAVRGAGAPANTVRSYEAHARRVGALGRVPVGEVQSMDLDRLYRELLRKGLDPMTVETFHWFLSGAFHWMVSTVRVIADNPCRNATYPRHGRKEAESFDFDEVPEVLAAIDDGLASERAPRRCAAMAAVLGFFLALRVGEACAVRWRDCDAHFGVVRIRGTVTMVRGRPTYQPYTKGGNIANVTAQPEVFERLDRWRKAQRARGVPVAPGLPVVTANGSWRRPDLVSGAFAALLRGAGLEGSFHKLRHTQATLLLAEGVSPKAVQDRLRHRTMATTLAMYAHSIPGMDAAAAAAYADMATRPEWEGAR